MVYCGKPSRGCQMCRTRRIKCDETKPTCKQCAKSRRQCPGYKDEFDLVFRNETQATERRAKKANKKALAQKMGGKEPPSPTDSSKSLTLSPTSTMSSRSPTDCVMPMLSIPVDQQASCHFVANFILIPRQDGSRGFMGFLLPLLRGEGSKHRALSHAFDACAYASLGNRPDAAATGIKELAISKYQKALESIQLVLQDAETSKSDSTLTAVLLLALYENITATEMGMLSWGRHIEGAIQLCKARGRDQLRTDIGRFLFIAVRTQMICLTITTGRAPIMGVEWWVTGAMSDLHATLSHRYLILTSELRAEVTRLMSTVSRSPENIELMLDMMRRAQTVDREIATWLREVPDTWAWKTVAWEDSVPNGDYSKADVFPGRVDIYPDFWIASVINFARVARLTLASIIVRCAAWVCSPVDYRTTPEYATAARMCGDTITDIIASVPYHLGWHLKRPDVLQKANMSTFPCGLEEAQKGLAGYFLTYPLAFVHGQDYCTDAQRTWVSGRLRYIGDEMGVKYSHILASLKWRLPSMLIRRDGLMAQPYPASHNFEKLLSARLAPPTAGYTMNPLQQREAMRKEFVHQKRAELINQASGSAGSSGAWLTENVLTV